MGGVASSPTRSSVEGGHDSSDDDMDMAGDDNNSSDDDINMPLHYDPDNPSRDIKRILGSKPPDIADSLGVPAARCA